MTMGRAKTDNRCKRIRRLLYSAAGRCVGPEAGWFREHVAECPRCQRRLTGFRKVELAFSFLKTQPHKFDLLARANGRAVAVLKHSLRAEPQARKLETPSSRPGLFEMFCGCGRSAGNIAACAAVLLLMKTGVLSSMDRFHSTGQKGIKRYYAWRVGEDMASDVFTQDAKPSSSARSEAGHHA